MIILLLCPRIWSRSPHQRRDPVGTPTRLTKVTMDYHTSTLILWGQMLLFLPREFLLFSSFFFCLNSSGTLCKYWHCCKISKIYVFHYLCLKYILNFDPVWCGHLKGVQDGFPEILCKSPITVPGRYHKLRPRPGTLNSPWV